MRKHFILLLYKLYGYSSVIFLCAWDIESRSGKTSFINHRIYGPGRLLATLPVSKSHIQSEGSTVCQQPLKEAFIYRLGSHTYLLKKGSVGGLAEMLL